MRVCMAFWPRPRNMPPSSSTALNSTLTQRKQRSCFKLLHGPSCALFSSRIMASERLLRSASWVTSARWLQMGLKFHSCTLFHSSTLAPAVRPSHFSPQSDHSSRGSSRTADFKDMMRLDHVCVVVDDVDRSIHFYSRVLGLRHRYENEPTFGKDPAFLESFADPTPTPTPTVEEEEEQSGNGRVRVALLPSSAVGCGGGEGHRRKHYGSHFAVSVSRVAFERWRDELPRLLARERAEWDFQERAVGKSQIVVEAKSRDGEEGGVRGGGGGRKDAIATLSSECAAKVDEQDYGLQLSLFFADPDNNMLEITAWVNPTDPRPLGFPVELPSLWHE